MQSVERSTLSFKKLLLWEGADYSAELPSGGSGTARDRPPPGCFGKRGCNLLKTKEASAKKRAQRDTRGGKPLKTWDFVPAAGAMT
jgi:hypothetical protein